jgi:hypothetical protein
MMQSVQVIIERLKTNPEDFFGYDGPHVGIPKFRNVVAKLDDLLIDKHDAGHIHRLWFLEPEEKEALLAAYKEARRARFEAQVFHDLLTAPTEVNLAVERMDTSGKRLMQGSAMRLDSSGNLGIGTTSPGMWQGAVPKQNMLAEATKILSDEFDKQYAKNRNPRP